MDALSETRRH